MLNLTQLRKNKRKRPDKTSGRKHPRTADVDIVAAPDADSERRNEGVADLDVVEPDETPAATIRQDICHTCDQDEPPTCKGRPHRGPVHWVRCDLCPRWYHQICVGLRNQNDDYTCDFCI